MFEDDGFEIYESTTKEYVIKDIHEAIEAPDKHLLEVREVLDSIKDRYYETAEQTANWTEEERTPVITKWIEQLAHLTGPVRKRGVNTALQELADEVDHVAEGLPRKWRRRFEDSEEEG